MRLDRLCKQLDASEDIMDLADEIHALHETVDLSKLTPDEIESRNNTVREVVNEINS
jgi:hypothetical protein